MNGLDEYSPGRVFPILQVVQHDPCDAVWRKFVRRRLLEHTPPAEFLPSQSIPGRHRLVIVSATEFRERVPNVQIMISQGFHLRNRYFSFLAVVVLPLQCEGVVFSHTFATVHAADATSRPRRNGT